MPYRKPDDGESIADAIPHRTPPRRYPCFADECPIPGTMFSGSTEVAGSCPYHWNASPLDVPRITRTLREWRCVVDAMNAARRLAVGPHAAAATTQLEHMGDVWTTLASAVDTRWREELEPGLLRVRDRSTEPHGWKTINAPELASDWARRLERFLGARVVESLSPRRHRQEV